MSKDVKESKIKQKDDHVWYTLNEAAKYLRVTRQTIYNYMQNGLLPYYELKVGRGRRLRREDLDALLVRREGDTPDRHEPDAE